MRKLVLKRGEVSLGEPVDATVICNAKTLGVLSKDQKEASFPLPTGECALQVQIVGPDAKLYRSNALFMLRNKDVHASFAQSGSKLCLSLMD